MNPIEKDLREVAGGVCGKVNALRAAQGGNDDEK